MVFLNNVLSLSVSSSTKLLYLVVFSLTSRAELGELTLGLRPREDKLSVAGDATRPQGVLQDFAGFFLNLLL